MTTTRDGVHAGPQVDTGTATPPATRPSILAYGGPTDLPVADTGIGSPVAARPTTQGDAFIPPKWII